MKFFFKITQASHLPCMLSPSANKTSSHHNVQWSDLQFRQYLYACYITVVLMIKWLILFYSKLKRIHDLMRRQNLKNIQWSALYSSSKLTTVLKLQYCRAPSEPDLSISIPQPFFTLLCKLFWFFNEYFSLFSNN